MQSNLLQDVALPIGITLDDIVEFAASAVIVNSDKKILLMLRNDYPVWVNSGRIVEVGETFELAMLREVSEEVGIKVDILRPAGYYLARVSDNPHKYRCEKLFLYTPADYSATPIIGDEGLHIEWFAANKLPFNIPPRYRVRIEETIRNSHILIKILDLPNTEKFVKDLAEEEIFGLDIFLSSKKNFSNRKMKYAN